MRIKGYIYNSKRTANHGETPLYILVVTRLFISLIRSIGAGLVAFSLISFSFTYGPIIKQEFLYNFNELVLNKHFKFEHKNEADMVASALAQDFQDVQRETINLGINSYFSLAIPKINAKSNIIANVDRFDKKEYLEALKNGVAHLKGTYFPGQGKTIFLFSHSTDSPLQFARYNAVFYLLGKLDKKDTIIVYFIDKKYIYEVQEKVVIKPSDTSWIKVGSEREQLILMTCDPPGTIKNRLLVIAIPRI